MAEVRFENVTKRFGDVVAVNNLSLDVHDKEFLVLVGPSGCGKTTALRMLAGLEEISDGKIFIDGQCVNNVAPKDRDIAMVFQNYALYPHMSVFDNIAFGLRLRELPAWYKLADRRKASADISRRVREAAEMLGLEKLLKRKPKELSGGQRQRVALARAIVRKPKVFLMDEPLSNLDAKLRVQTRAELIKLQRELGITTVYVTHDQVEAMTMGQRIVVMKEGVIQQIDNPLNAYQKPANLFVAGFIGTPPINLVPVSLKDGAEGLILQSKSFQIAAPIESETLKNYIGRDLMMGIRPENIALTSGIEGIKAVAEVVEPMGNETIAYFKIGDIQMTSKLSGKTLLSIGDHTSIILDIAHARFFDPATGERVH